MYRTCTLSFILALGVCLSLSTAQTPEYLTVLHLNDTHSNLAAGAPRDAESNPTVGGIARAATIIAAEKAVDPDALTLHAGDSFIGDPAYNFSMGTLVQPELQLLLQLGVDAMAVGNHEFDLGPDPLLGCLAASFPAGGFPLLSANLDYSAAPQHALQSFIAPNMVKQCGAVKVGIFGMTTPEVELIGTAAPIVVSDDIITIAAAQIAELQGQGCDVIIFLSHLGIGTDRVLAAGVPGIHLIVGGHSHAVLTAAEEVPNSGGSTYIVQSGEFYREMGITKLKIENGAVTLEEYSLIVLDGNVAEEASMKAAVDGLYGQLDLAFGGILLTDFGEATGLLTEVIVDCTVEGNLDTHVGNMCADAYAAATGADFAFQPGGSTAQPLYPGPVKGLDLFRCIGYGFNEDNGIGFRVVTVDMTGEAIHAALETTLGFVELNDEMLIHPSAGFEYGFNPQAVPGGRIHTLNYQSAPVDFAQTYTVAINELLLLYLNALGMFNPTITYTNLQTYPSSLGMTTLTEFEALLGYVAAAQTLSPDPLPGRVTSLITPVIPPPAPAALALDQNSPNPFVAETSLRFAVPARMHVSMSVHDAVGRKVAVLADREFEGGMHQLRFNAAGLPSGLYFCRLLAGDAQRAIRMLIAR
jgi:5'-nucleotidase/UDP-sugar diphosphatase